MTRPLDVQATSPAGALLRSAWQPVCRSVDLAPGQVAPLTVLGERWTLWRSEQGQPALIGAACPHRGTSLAAARVRGPALACMHHGWAYDAQGRCTQRPDGGDCSAVPVPAAPARDHLGLVFAWLGAGPPRPLPLWPAFDQPGTLRVLHPQVWPCPFMLRLENSLDISHLPIAHAASGVGDLLDAKAPVEIEDLADGLVVRARAQVPIAVRLLLPNALCFPTPVSESAGWRDHLVWRVPIDDHHCVSFVVTHVPADVPDHAAHAMDQPRSLQAPSQVAVLGERLLAGLTSWPELAGQASLTEIEDYIALCGVLRDGDGPALAGEHLGPADEPVRALRRRWAAALRGEARVWTGPAAG